MPDGVRGMVEFWLPWEPGVAFVIQVNTAGGHQHTIPTLIDTLHDRVQHLFAERESASNCLAISFTTVSVTDEVNPPLAGRMQRSSRS